MTCGGDALDVGQVQSELDLGTGRNLLEQRIDELHGAAQGAFGQKDGVDVDGTDDEIDPAGAQMRQPFRAERPLAAVEPPLQQPQWQVAVEVGKTDLARQPPSASATCVAIRSSLPCRPSPPNRSRRTHTVGCHLSP